MYPAQIYCLVGIKVIALRLAKVLLMGLPNHSRVTLFQGMTPYLVNATSGSTVFGAYDPLDAIADICQKYKLWMHVDGAWGAAALLSRKYKGFMKGIERSVKENSVTNFSN